MYIPYMVPDKEESWEHRALCAQMDPAIWFPGSKRGDSALAIRARNLCLTCEVLEKCREDTIKIEMDSLNPTMVCGVRGGLLQSERRKMYKQLIKERNRNGKDSEEADSEAI